MFVFNFLNVDILQNHVPGPTGPNSTSSSEALDVTISLPWNVLDSLLTTPLVAECGQFFMEMACKWTCNIISTGAHIIRGKIYENIMIDVRVR